MPTEPAGGGLAYSLPLGEVAVIAAALRRDVAAARRNGLQPDELELRRLADLELVLSAMRPQPAVVSDVVEPVVAPLHGRKVVEMGSGSGSELSLAEVAAARNTSRQAVLAQVHRGTLPARKDERGRWRVPVAAIERGA